MMDDFENKTSDEILNELFCSLNIPAFTSDAYTQNFESKVSISNECADNVKVEDQSMEDHEVLILCDTNNVEKKKKDKHLKPNKKHKHSKKKKKKKDSDRNSTEIYDEKDKKLDIKEKKYHWKERYSRSRSRSKSRYYSSQSRSRSRSQSRQGHSERKSTRTYWRSYSRSISPFIKRKKCNENILQVKNIETTTDINKDGTDLINLDNIPLPNSCDTGQSPLSIPLPTASKSSSVDATPAAVSNSESHDAKKNSFDGCLKLADDKTKLNEKAKSEEGEKSKGKAIVIKSLKDSIVFQQAQEEAERKSRETDSDGGINSINNNTDNFKNNRQYSDIEEGEIICDDEMEGKPTSSNNSNKFKDSEIKLNENKKLKKQNSSSSRKRSTSRVRESRSSSRSRSKHSWHSKSRSRSIHSSRSRSRESSHSKSRHHRSSSRSRRKDCSKRLNRSHSLSRQYRSRSKSRKYEKSKRKHEQSRSPASSRSPSRKKQRKASGDMDLDDLRNKVTRRRLLEIAQQNAAYILQNDCLPPNVAASEFGTIKNSGKTIAELTNFCKKLVAENGMSDDENFDLSPHSDDPERPFIVTRHPFAVKDKPIKLNIRNAPMIPVKSNAERLADQAKLRELFPVSSGSLHRNKEWVPVEPKEKKIEINEVVGGATGSGGGTESEAHEEDRVFPPKMQNWALSKQQPGQFLGSTGAKVMTQEELASGYQAWARKGQLREAAPVSSHFGMKMLQKMGWTPGEGLGKNKEGTLEPLLLDIKIDKLGFHSQEEFLRKRPPLLQGKEVSGKHPVSALVEVCCKRKWGPPSFEIVFDCGPDHKKNFLMKVRINNIEYQPSFAAPTKKLAKANAATAALQTLGLLTPELPLPPPPPQL